MPQQTIRYDGVTHTFPDDFTEAQIAAALKSYSPEQPAAPQPPAEPTVRSVMENASLGEGSWNAVKSLGGLVKNMTWDIGEGVYDLAKLRVKYELGDAKTKAEIIDQINGTLKQLPSAVIDSVAKDYGSTGRFAQTLYTDPFKVVSDVMAVASGGGMALKGAAKAGELSGIVRAGTTAAKVANAARTTGNVILKGSEMLDPAAGVLKVAGKTIDKTGRGIIGATLKPQESMLDDFGVTKKEFTQRVQKSGVTNLKDARESQKVTGEAGEALAKQLDETGRAGDSQAYIEAVRTGPAAEIAESMARHGKKGPQKKFDKLIDDLTTEFKTSDAVPAVPPTTVEGASTADEAANLARVQSELGPTARTIPSSVLGNVDPSMRARVEQLGAQANMVPPRFLANPQGVRIGGSPAVPAQFKPMSPSQLWRDRQIAQDAAYELTRANRGFESELARSKARALKGQIDEHFKELSESATASQQAKSVRQAFEHAEKNQPDRGSNILKSVAVGTMTGNPMLGLGTHGMLSAAESPRLGAAFGIGAHNVANFMTNPKIVSMVRAMRAAGARQDETDAAIMQEMLKKD